MDDVRMSACGEIGAATAVFLGGIAAIVTLIADTDDHSLPSDDTEAPEIVRVRTHTAPPPVAPDAGVAGGLDAGSVDATFVDASAN
jgi:hypothetical protein